MTIQTYLAARNKRFQSGIAKEHAYHVDLEGLIRALIRSVSVTHSPVNVTDSRKPDFVIPKAETQQFQIWQFHRDDSPVESRFT